MYALMDVERARLYSLMHVEENTIESSSAFIFD